MSFVSWEERVDSSRRRALTAGVSRLNKKLARAKGRARARFYTAIKEARRLAVPLGKATNDR